MVSLLIQEGYGVMETSTRETLGFQAEVRQLLKLMIHSLYSNKEIFLRELISNASDAADKLRFEALANPELTGDDADLAITIEIDKKNRQLSVVDNGIGMSRDELIDNLGTIARSGTAEFLEKMTGDKQHDAQLIGQFGVGFYSSFIVADKVTVETRRAGESADQGVRWESDGQGEFSVETIERGQRGTRVTLHLKEDETDFVESFRIEALIRKYSDHIGFPVALVDHASDDQESKVVNSATALWTRSRSEITDDEYKEFYKYLTHDFADPLTWSHNRVEGKREYTSLLYIPATAPFDLWNREAPRGLKLYVQRVFIMDEAEQFLPLYLRFVKGVVDSSDLPLNVSRELLQRNPELTSIRSALTRRVLDMLGKMAGSDEERYQSFWQQFGQVLKEGLVEDHANRDKLAKLLRFATTHNGNDTQDQSLEDYVARATPEQDKIYYLLAENYATAVTSPHLEKLRERGIEVLLLTDRIDPWLVDGLADFDGKTLVDVARSALDLPDEEAKVEQATDKEHEALLEKVKTALSERVESVTISRRLVDSPACVVAADSDLNPQLRRMLEASGQALLAEGSQLEKPADYVQRINKLLLDMDTGNQSGQETA
jgi:molecular chaperone HtpG